MYEPLGSMRTIVDEVDVFVTPFRVTDHALPAGRPVSVNVTL